MKKHQEGISKISAAGKAGHFPSFLRDLCFLMVFLTFCSNIYQGCLEGVCGKIKANPNFHGQKETSVGARRGGGMSAFIFIQIEFRVTQNIL